MCLLVLAVGRHPEHPVILAGNRDEFHARSATEAHWWTDKPDILGGRDLEAGGTWLALHRNGRFATVTNFRDAQPRSPGRRSRGHLVTDYLESAMPPLQYLRSIDGLAYAGFNLLVGDTQSVAYLSNRGADARELAPGIYGLSNALLDSPWEKVVRSKAAFARLLEDGSVSHADLLELLGDRREGSDALIEPGLLGEAMARALTAPFIVT
ncbi:MAG: NRDE family protein, partial [Gammaproteobacteria bacterium]|nr:NRDE family protein [Gammaproteobacteria bacterium]